MKIAVELLILFVCLALVGGVIGFHVLNYPRLSPLWVFPATLFVFIPAVAFGAIISFRIWGS